MPAFIENTANNLIVETGLKMKKMSEIINEAYGVIHMPCRLGNGGIKANKMVRKKLQ